jgi:hypothetical protein
MQLGKDAHECSNGALDSSNLASPRIDQQPPRMFLFLRCLDRPYEHLPGTILIFHPVDGEDDQVRSLLVNVGNCSIESAGNPGLIFLSCSRI